MLLLFTRLGEDPPLTARNYRSLRRMLEALGEADGDPDRELDLPELLRLGQTRQEAEAILRRLETAELLTVRSVAHNGRLRKYYRITQAGQDRLDAFAEEWKEIMAIYQFVVREETDHG